MTVTRFATADQYNDFLCAGLDLTDVAVKADIENALDIAAADMYAAMAAQGAVSCSLADWANAFLGKLNIIDAAVLQNCPCGNQYSDAQKQVLLDWMTGQLELIRTGKLPLCEGDTGSEWPAFGSVEMSLTAWNAEQITVNGMLKRGNF